MVRKRHQNVLKNGEFKSTVLFDAGLFLFVLQICAGTDASIEFQDYGEGNLRNV